MLNSEENGMEEKMLDKITFENKINKREKKHTPYKLNGEEMDGKRGKHKKCETSE